MERCNAWCSALSTQKVDTENVPLFMCSINVINGQLSATNNPETFAHTCISIHAVSNGRSMPPPLSFWPRLFLFFFFFLTFYLSHTCAAEHFAQNTHAAVHIIGRLVRDNYFASDICIYEVCLDAPCTHLFMGFAPGRTGTSFS